MLSLSPLRRLILAAFAILANLGVLSLNLNRSLSHPDAWISRYQDLLNRNGILQTRQVASVINTLAELSLAVQDASLDSPLDLQEALDLQALMGRVTIWYDHAPNFAPKRNLRVSPGKSRRRDCIWINCPTQFQREKRFQQT
mmetsp:Transcript_12219/g.18625  ORF Transcript_12219/g.18625 Transcript_12219/m.18625 type:complete len:142 (-) Transcript_12219:228-653(-)